MGADIILIDDPLKPDDARRAARKSANDWLDNTLLSRLNNKQEGAIVIIMQRLHLDDLVGHNYKKEGIMLTDISPISMVQGDLLEPLAAGDKVGGSPFGAPSHANSSMSCYKCGQHKPRALGSFKRLLNQSMFICAECRPTKTASEA